MSYGGESGPDLAAVAEFGGCSETGRRPTACRLSLSRVHARVSARLCLYGIGRSPHRDAAARHAADACRRGSVGIAGAQTGIYPCETPGGWRIIGRTSTKMFDSAAREAVSA